MDDSPARLRQTPPDDEPSQTELARREIARHRPRIRNVPLLILCLLAIFYTLYFAAELILPIVMAAVLKLVLQPGMRFLTTQLRLPTVLAAFLMVLSLLCAGGAVVALISAPASDWLAKAPTSLSVLEQRLELVRKPIEVVQRTAKRLESIASTSGDAPAVAVQEAGIGNVIFRGTRTVLAQLLTMFVVLFFLLAASDTFLRRLVEILPSFSDKKRAVEIVSEVEQNIAIYLLTITTMNTVVGVATGLMAWACGIPDPVLWGAVAFLLNFVQILGPTVGVAMFFVVGLMTLPTVWLAVVPAAAYLMIHMMEGEFITPMLLARRFTLNPVLVVGSLFVWYWLWGVPGALLAVPLLAIFKIVADRVPTLMPIGHLIGANGPHGKSGPLA